MPLKTNYASFFMSSASGQERGKSFSDFFTRHSPLPLASLSHLARAMRCEDELSQLSNGFVVAAVECTYTLDQGRNPKGVDKPSPN